jgi:hypothetical protein
MNIHGFRLQSYEAIDSLDFFITQFGPLRCLIFFNVAHL